MDRFERDGHFAMVMLAIVGAIGILRYVLDSYPLPIQLATGLPALAAIGIGLASFGFSAKSDKFKLAGLQWASRPSASCCCGCCISGSPRTEGSQR